MTAKKLTVLAGISVLTLVMLGPAGIAAASGTARAATAGTASAKPSYVRATSSIDNIACPVTTRCESVGTGGSSVVPVFTDVATGKATAATSTITGIIDSKPMACVSPTACYFVGNDVGPASEREVVVRFGPGHSLTITAYLNPPANQYVTVEGISCQGSRDCWISGWEQSFLTGATTAGVLWEISPGGRVIKTIRTKGYDVYSGVTCESKTTCLFVSSLPSETIMYGVVPLINGKIGKARAFPAGEVDPVLSCYGAWLCYALVAGGPLDTYVSNLLYPLSPRNGAIGKVIKIGDKNFDGSDIDCYSKTSCVAVGQRGVYGASDVVSKGKAGKDVIYKELTEGVFSVGCTSRGVCFGTGQNAVSGGTEGFVLRV